MSAEAEKPMKTEQFNNWSDLVRELENPRNKTFNQALAASMHRLDSDFVEYRAAHDECAIFGLGHKSLPNEFVDSMFGDFYRSVFRGAEELAASTSLPTAAKGIRNNLRTLGVTGHYEKEANIQAASFAVLGLAKIIGIGIAIAIVWLAFK